VIFTKFSPKKNAMEIIHGAEKFMRQILLHTLLRKARTLGRTLTGFELRIAFADHVKRATAFDHLAVCVAAFGGVE
jgi:hypothetical protein